MRASRLLLVSFTAALAASTPTPTSSTTAPVYSCPAPVDVNGSGVGKSTLVCCANVYGQVLGEDTGTGIDCALSSGGVGTQGSCTDSARRAALCCNVYVSAEARIVLCASTDWWLSDWQRPRRRDWEHTDGLWRAKTSVKRLISLNLWKLCQCWMVGIKLWPFVATISSLLEYWCYIPMLKSRPQLVSRPSWASPSAKNAVAHVV